MGLKTNVSALKGEAIGIFKDAKDILESMNEVNEWNSVEEILTNMDKLNAVILRVISSVEVAAENLKADYTDIKSGDKLETATAMLDDAIKLPFWLELIDGVVIKVAISMAISLMNQTGETKFDKEQAIEILKGELFPIVGGLLAHK